MIGRWKSLRRELSRSIDRLNAAREEPHPPDHVPLIVTRNVRTVGAAGAVNALREVVATDGAKLYGLPSRCGAAAMDAPPIASGCDRRRSSRFLTSPPRHAADRTRLSRSQTHRGTARCRRARCADFHRAGSRAGVETPEVDPLPPTTLPLPPGWRSAGAMSCRIVPHPPKIEPPSKRVPTCGDRDFARVVPAAVRSCELSFEIASEGKRPRDSGETLRSAATVRLPSFEEVLHQDEREQIL